MVKNTIFGFFALSAVSLTGCTSGADYDDQNIIDAKITSAYTNLKKNNCVVVAKTNTGSSLSCDGYKGYKIHLTDGDQRIAVVYGYVNDRFGGSFESFSPFNDVNDTTEWRLMNGKAVAAIQRWYINVPDVSSAKKYEVLVVSKVGQPETGDACVVGYVDARSNHNANVQARKVADQVWNSFRCSIDVPQFHGKAGVVASYVDRYIPDATP